MIRLPLPREICLIPALLLPLAIRAEALPNTPPGVEARVDRLLAQLTLDEKLSLITGDRDFYIRPIPRLGLPEIKMADGPLGVRNYGNSTAYPGTVALAASWDVALGREFGASLGRDSRARGVHILLAPAVNIHRVPVNGRNFEYLGEDPFLAAQFGAAVVTGIQSKGVVATVKHYAANNQETERMSVDARVGERALREIYLPAFRAAVQDGHAWAVMDAYNRLNGHFATESDWLNNQVLKREWGFPGVVMSDWGAVHETLAPLQGGLDLEMPGNEFWTAEKLKPLLDSGKITATDIDARVRRILRLEVANGFPDRTQADATIPADDPRSADVARQIAAEGMVLLKNEKEILPLDSTRTKSIVVLGPNADVHPAGGGSSQVRPFHSVSVLAGLRAALGPGVRVEHIPGLGVRPVQQLIDAARYEAPLQLELFGNRDFAGAPVTVRPENAVDHDWSEVPPAPGLGLDNYSARWTGTIKAPPQGRCSFVIQCDDGGRVYLDEKLILDVWGDHATMTKQVDIDLDPGSTHRLRIDYYQHSGGAIIRFGWGASIPPNHMTADQIALVRQADAVVACVGYDSDTESEGFDRTYELPDGQPELLQKIAELNPRTVVVLNSGGGVATADWLAKVPALLQAWYPGQEGGHAVAGVLLGKVNPGGKLPFTWEKRWEDIAAFGHYPGADGHADYAEGIFVGYRWFDHKGIAPLFPFGFGLSYTTFKYDGLRITPTANNHGYAVSFRITNTGARAGAEVAQIYVAPPSHTKIERAPRELKGFVRMQLAPGETKSAAIELARDAFAYFDESQHHWTVEPGSYNVIVGASSHDPRLQAAIEVR
jgi:beta-glucosidase